MTIGQKEIDAAIAKYKVKKQTETEIRMSVETKRKERVSKIEAFLSEIQLDKKVAELLAASNESIYLYQPHNPPYDSYVYLFESDGEIALSAGRDYDGELDSAARILLEYVGDVEKVRAVYEAEIRRIIESAS